MPPADRFTTNLFLNSRSTIPPSGVPVQVPGLSEADQARLLEIEDRVEQQIKYYTERAGRTYYRNPLYMRLDMLPPEDRAAIIEDVEEIRGFRRMLEESGPEWIPGHEPGPGVRRPFGRFNVAFGPESDENTLFYLTHYIQHQGRNALGNESADDLYSISGRLLRPTVLKDLMTQVRTPTPIKGKVAVVDLETSGLEAMHGIWQGTVRTFDAAGKEDTIINRYFKEPLMNMGRMGRHGRTPMEELITRKGGVSYSDFTKGMSDMMRQMMTADVVTGHNVLFDIEKMLTQSVSHAAYTRDEQFRNTVNEFLENVVHGGKIRDTSLLARATMAGEKALPVAPETLLSRTGTQFSLQNILLESNLIEKMAAEPGMRPGRIADELRRGLHFADIDTFFEKYLFKYLHEGTLAPKHLEDEALRGLISGSRPVTPMLGLATWEDIHPEIEAKMRPLGMAPGDMTPFEQDVFLSRRFLETGEGALPSADNINIWSEVAGKFASPETKRLIGDPQFPGIKDTQDFQRKLAEGGIPHAGLSPYERHMSSIFGSTKAPGAEGEVREMFGGLLNIGRFHETKKIRVAGETNKVALLPHELLERAGVVETDRPLYYSPFYWGRNTETGRAKAYDVGLHYRLTPEESERLVGYIESNRNAITRQYGFEEFDELVEAIRATGDRGISVGTLSGGITNPQLEHVYNAVLQMMGRAEDWTDQRIPWATHVLRRENGILYTGTSFVDKLLNDQERFKLSADNVKSFELYQAGQQLDSATKTTLNMAARRRVQGAQARGEAAESERASTWERFWNRLDQRIFGDISEGQILQKVQDARLFRKMKWGFAGAAVLGAGYYEYRHRRHHSYQDTMALQPAEPSGWYDQYQTELNDMVPKEMVAQAGLSPLSTAGIMNALHLNKTRHTQMGSAQNKYSYMFTGYQT